jgi:flagellin
MAIGINSTIQNGLVSNLNKINSSKFSSIRKLSSGYRINKAADDAAGLSVATKLNVQASSLRQAQQNTNIGSAMLNIAEGGLNQISNMLSRAKELAVQSANGTLDDSTRQSINMEFNAIVSEITRIADTTKFGDQQLISGDLSSGSSNQADIQVGDSNTSADQINLNVIEGATSSQLGVDTVDVSTAGNAQDAIAAIDSAIDQISSTRANVGTAQNRLSYASSNLGTSIENLTSAASTIMDTDIAAEVSSLARSQVAQEATISVLKSANASKLNLIGKLLNATG